jgi:hypothetical protein
MLFNGTKVAWKQSASSSNPPHDTKGTSRRLRFRKVYQSRFLKKLLDNDLSICLKTSQQFIGRQFSHTILENKAS